MHGQSVEGHADPGDDGGRKSEHRSIHGELPNFSVRRNVIAPHASRPYVRSTRRAVTAITHRRGWLPPPPSPLRRGGAGAPPPPPPPPRRPGPTRPPTPPAQP